MTAGDEAGTDRNDRAQARHRILSWCAGIVALFAPADWLAWIAVILAGSLALRRAELPRTRRVVAFLAAASTVFYAALVQLTGATHGPLFGWMVVFPVAVALLVQDYPGAIVTTGAALIVCGLG